MQNESENLLVEIVSDIRKKLEEIAASSRVWLTPEQLASYIGLSANTIYQYVSKGRIPYFKIPHSSKLLFRKTDIDDWVAGNKNMSSTEHEAREAADEIWGKI